MNRVRLIDEIWERISQLSLTQESDVTCLKITKGALVELLEDYREEFFEEEADLDTLQEYLGLEILIANGIWSDGKRFELLKSVEF